MKNFHKVEIWHSKIFFELPSALMLIAQSWNGWVKLVYIWLGITHVGCRDGGLILRGAGGCGRVAGFWRAVDCIEFSHCQFALQAGTSLGLAFLLSTLGGSGQAADGYAED